VSPRSRPDPNAPTLFDALAAEAREAEAREAEAREAEAGEAAEGVAGKRAAGKRAAGDLAAGERAATVGAGGAPAPPAPGTARGAHARASAGLGGEVVDPHAVELVADVPARLAPFNAAGVLHPADVHTATALCGASGCADPDVLLATALAVRGPRVGHVCVDLATVRDTVADVEDDAATLRDLPWPDDVDAWIAAVAAADQLVRSADEPCAVPAAEAAVVPCALTLHGSRLYLDRYWRYEQRLADALQARATAPAPGVDLDRCREGLDHLFGPPGTERGVGPDLQRLAAATAVTRQLAVIAGGPGTGKTTTVARVLALLDEQAAATRNPPPRVALVAPTGKAAARLQESLREALERPEFAENVDDDVLRRLATAEASTIHRLLRRHPGNQSRFRHGAGAPLPHDVVVVDEASMVSLALMAKLLDALPPTTRLLLVGDPQQLRSVEAGAVLGDIVGPALGGLRLGPRARATLAAATGEDLATSSRAGDGPTTAASAAGDPDGGGPGDAAIGDGIVVLQRVHRFDETSGIADLAAAIQAGDGDEVVRLLDDPSVGDVRWLHRADDADDDEATDLTDLRREVTGVGTRLGDAASAGDAAGALAAVDELRLLCAHRRGPFGVATWVPRVEGWLGVTRSFRSPGPAWEVGTPVLVTSNDHQLRIYNGDVGVVVATDDGPRVAFPRAADEPRLVAPGRLEGLEPVHAMTIHKSQGSQFGHAVVVLPTPDSRILSRELLYTGVTRAQRQVTVVGSEAAVRAAVDRVVRRASGLRDRLWPADR
jgi:exodeoxyribonuclease V alpha subunit